MWRDLKALANLLGLFSVKTGVYQFLFWIFSFYLLLHAACTGGNISESDKNWVTER